MIAKGEEELICDLAETYHILNYKELPPTLVATLSVGLRDNSRIKQKLTGNKLTLEQMLECIIADSVQMILWSKTKDAEHGRNKPQSIFQKLMGLDEKEKDDLISFKTPEQYEEYMMRKREEWKNEQ